MAPLENGGFQQSLWDSASRPRVDSLMRALLYITQQIGRPVSEADVRRLAALPASGLDETAFLTAGTRLGLVASADDVTAANLEDLPLPFALLAPDLSVHVVVSGRGNRWTVLDPLASVVVGLMLVKVSLELLNSSVGELTEHSLSNDIEKEIEDIICSFPDVSQPHNLRTRRIGNRVAIEAHVRMDGDVSLTMAHNRATAIEQRLRERFGPQTHITIHMEPSK